MPAHLANAVPLYRPATHCLAQAVYMCICCGNNRVPLILPIGHRLFACCANNPNGWGNLHLTVCICDRRGACPLTCHLTMPAGHRLFACCAIHPNDGGHLCPTVYTCACRGPLASAVPSSWCLLATAWPLAMPAMRPSRPPTWQLLAETHCKQQPVSAVKQA